MGTGEARVPLMPGWAHPVNLQEEKEAEPGLTCLFTQHWSLLWRLVLRKEGAALPGPSCQSPHSCGCWWSPAARLLPASARTAAVHSSQTWQPSAEGTFQDTLDSLSTLCPLPWQKPDSDPGPILPASSSLAPLHSL